ncbi:MAG: non-canonical purine NTP pyrophosphatase [Thermoguttaceae bacterium]|jgi:XTP/dITP diphosphohydrolase
MIIIGTANLKKGRELADLFQPVGVELKTLADFPGAPAVPEDGETFAANAVLKAAGYARQLRRWVLADDSGLLVDALDGRPGVLSARFAGEDATDEGNNLLLLELLGDTPIEKRSAQFVCHMALADPEGSIRAESEAACRGRILFQPRGNNGFGYDPLFEIVEYHRSFAEFGQLVKACLSHRARAARLLIPRLMELVDSGKMVNS